MSKLKGKKILLALAFITILFLGNRIASAQNNIGLDNNSGDAKTEQKSLRANDVIADLLGKATVTDTNPITGTNFSLEIQLNSKSNGSESTDDIKGYTVSFVIPEHVEFKGIANSSLYVVTPANPTSGDTLTIKFKDDVTIAQLTKIKVNLAFKAGTTINSDIFEPTINLSADNATETSFKSEKATARTLDIPDVMETTKEPVNPTFAHSTTIDLKSEGYYGGINHENASITLDFDLDTEIHTIKYNGKTYTAVDNGAGRKSVTIPIGDFNVADQDREVVVVYSYPPLMQEGSKDYDINVMYNANRYRTNEKIEQKAIISETVQYETGAGESNKYFEKRGTLEAYRKADQPITYELDFNPPGDTKNAAIIDDPIRGGEADFFDGLEFSQIKWQAYPGYDATYNKGISTSVFYALKSNPNVWVKASEASISGTFNFENVASGSDYVAKIKLEYSYDGSKEVPAKAGKTLARVFANTKDTIINNNSLADGITNSAYIIGQKKGVQATQYEDIIDDGVTNLKDAHTKYREALPELGYQGWENPFSPSTVKIGEEFNYRINVANIGAAPAHQVVAYLVTSSKIDITDISFPNGDNSNTTIEMKDNGTNKTYIIRFNDTINPTGWWTGSKFQIAWKGKAQPGINDSKFTLYYSTEDPETKFGGSNANVNNTVHVPNIGNVPAGKIGVGFNAWLNIDMLLSVTPVTKASVDDLTYDTKASTVVTNPAGEEGYYSIDINNALNSESDLEKVNIIDMLPTLGDTMTISENAKNSNYAPIVKGLVMADGSALSNAQFDVFYSTDATYQTNRAELDDHTDINATWIAWDGASDLPSDAKAIKIIKKDGLAKGAQVKLKLKVQLPSDKTGLNVAWNAISASGSYTDTTGATIYTAPGEPHKAGIYVSDSAADKELAGVIWEDLNGNQLKDDNETRISNVVVRLYDWNNDYIDETTTNANGEYSFSGLYAAKYRVEFDNIITYKFVDYKVGNDTTIDNNFIALNSDEKIASANVNLATEASPLNVDAGLYREASIGDYIWDDIDNNGIQNINESGIKDIKVSLYKISNTRSENLLKTTLSDANGKYMFTGLTPGEYKIKVDQLASYKPTTPNVGAQDATDNSKLERTWETKVFTLNSAQNNLGIDLGLTTFANTGSITLTKVDENNAPLADAVFGIWPANANTTTDLPLLTSTSDAQGMVTFTNLILGDYIVKEYIAPSEYILDNTKYTVTLDDDNLIKDLGNIANQKVIGSISLTKQGEYNQLLSNVEFSIWKGNADVNVDNPLMVKSTVNGKLTFENLAVGEYIVKETKSLDDYKDNNKVYKISVNNKDYNIDIGTVLNYKVAGSIKMNKVDTQNNVLANATFGIWNKGDNSAKKKPIVSATSNKYGQIKVKGLPLGNYYLKEIKAPKGYQLSNKKVSFSITKDNVNVVLNDFVNNKKKENIVDAGSAGWIIVAVCATLSILLVANRRKFN